MTVHTSETRLSTGGDSDVIEITRAVAGAVAASGITDGQASACLLYTSDAADEL